MRIEEDLQRLQLQHHRNGRGPLNRNRQQGHADHQTTSAAENAPRSLLKCRELWLYQNYVDRPHGQVAMLQMQQLVQHEAQLRSTGHQQRMSSVINSRSHVGRVIRRVVVRLEAIAPSA